MNPSGNYLELLRKRGKESKAYQKHQSIGVELAEILSDKKHVALYIKLAKDNPPGDQLIRLAKVIAEKGNVKNKGAYFMRLITLKQSDGR